MRTVADAQSTYDRYDAAFRSKSFKPVYYFYGKETFLLDKLQATLIEEALEPHERDFNLTIVYGSEADPKEVLAECSSYPLMAQRRVVLIRGFEEMEGNELFAAYSKNPNPSAIVVIISAGDVRHNPYKSIKESAESAKFDRLSDRQLPGWITKEFRSHSLKLESEAAEVLIQLIGSDLRLLSHEIDKLVSFVNDRSSVTAGDVLDVTGQSREFNVFELQRNVEKKKFTASAGISAQMLQVSSNETGTALMTVSILNAYFTKLSKLARLESKGGAPADLAKAIGVPAFTLRKYQAALKRFSPKQRAAAHEALLAADFEIKGGSDRGNRLILALLLRRLSSVGNRNIVARAS